MKLFQRLCAFQNLISEAFLDEKYRLFKISCAQYPRRKATIVFSLEKKSPLLFIYENEKCQLIFLPNSYDEFFHLENSVRNMRCCGLTSMTYPELIFYKIFYSA